nr:immunoglobulin light chain junction region [Macaca mulatta]MOW16707.1 immunoglobulin light chain junction region [Macaca mulatta]
DYYCALYMGNGILVF